MYLWLKLLHLLTILILAVGNVGALFVAIQARRAATAIEVLTLIRAHHFMVTRGIIPGAVGSLLTGVALNFQLRAPWTELWLVGTYAGWVLSLLIGVALLVPAESGAIAEGERLVAAGITEPSAALRKFVGAPKVFVPEWATVILLVAMMFFMVVRPR